MPAAKAGHSIIALSWPRPPGPSSRAVITPVPMFRTKTRIEVENTCRIDSRSPLGLRIAAPIVERGSRCVWDEVTGPSARSPSPSIELGRFHAQGVFLCLGDDGRPTRSGFAAFRLQPAIQ